MSVPVDDGYCFACGPENPIGMHLHFEPDRDGVRAQTTLAREFQGWQSVAHGGIAMSLLDEAMAHAAGAAGHRGVTASINVRFRKPVPIGEPLAITGRVAWQRRNVLGLEAQVRDAAGVVLADGEGKFVSMGPLDAVDDYRVGRA
ncbi:MAG TPA: PaaI family thioesterase [Candidatus Acidoferrales bacterium]|nr:PaaI family thioesterase [Candidatus Acidoferrales bacterium]